MSALPIVGSWLQGRPYTDRQWQAPFLIGDLTCYGGPGTTVGGGYVSDGKNFAAVGKRDGRRGTKPHVHPRRSRASKLFMDDPLGLCRVVIGSPGETISFFQLFSAATALLRG